MEKIGKKIRQFRKAANLSADDLAGAIGRIGENRKQYVYDLERGRIKKIDIETMSKIAEILGTPINYFIEEERGSIHKNVGKVSIDDRTIEIGWKEKYLKLVEQNSELKSEIIQLLKNVKACQSI